MCDRLLELGRREQEPVFGMSGDAVLSGTSISPIHIQNITDNIDVNTTVIPLIS